MSADNRNDRGGAGARRPCRELLVILLLADADLDPKHRSFLAEQDGDRGPFLRALKGGLGGAFLFAVGRYGNGLGVVGDLEFLGLLTLLVFHLERERPILE